MSFPFQYLLLLLLLLLVCFFLHACNSRPLGLLHKESGEQLHFGRRKQDEGKESLEETSIRLKHGQRSIFEELLPEAIHMAKFGGKKSPQSLVTANKMELKAIDLKQENINKGIDHKKVPSSLEVSQEDTKIKGWKILARSTMESKKQDDTDENVKSEENGTVEDVVVMDYAQPHRKPPIHNLEH